MATSGHDLVQKWISKNKEMGLTDEELQSTSFIYGNTIYSIKKNNAGQFEIQNEERQLIIFRDFMEISDEYICRICGSEYDNKLDTIRCCMNDNE